MPAYKFDFSFVKGGSPVVTLSSIGLAFNTGARSMLGYPEKVEIGYDEQQKAIAIRPYSGDDKTPSYDFETRQQNGWVRIGAKDFMKYLSIQTGIDFITKAIQ